mmetsp:Transcript_56429/g.132355  ORF Transcript_56429/g.132355 Transcript_56429/m.132355 type:complete len:101 (+) Transcript_56429:188-490(+)
MAATPVELLIVTVRRMVKLRMVSVCQGVLRRRNDRLGCGGKEAQSSAHPLPAKLQMSEEAADQLVAATVRTLCPGLAELAAAEPALGLLHERCLFCGRRG